MNDLVIEAGKLQAEFEEYRCNLHQNPELGMELPKTAAFVKQKLEDMGYEASYISGCGVTALAGGKKPGKVVLLRADMDALPIQEEAEIECKSTNQNMHACGHDFHTTMLLGAAKLLKTHEDEIEGTVKFMFQPGEEVLMGSKTMIKDGILQNPAVDVAMMIHVVTGYPVPAGTVIVPPAGAFTAASDHFEIDIQGKGGHGAMPESTIDPLIVASHIHLALQEIRSREIAGGESVVYSVCLIEGGISHNIVPDTAKMKGTLRTFNPKVQEFVHERIASIAKCVAEGFRAKAEVKIIKGCPSAVNDKEAIIVAKDIFKRTFPPQAVLEVADFGMTKVNTSEDFSFVTQEVPSVVVAVGAGNAKEGYQYPLHHPKAEFDVSALPIGAAAYASFALEWLKENK